MVDDFSRYFYEYQPPKSIEDVQADIEGLRKRIVEIIGNAVSGDLNPAAVLRDSGVQWVGGIPPHWDVVRTKHVARLESGHTPSRKKPEYWQDCTIPWISLADVWQLRDGQRVYIEKTKECVSDLGLANSAARLLPAETVVLSRTASVGFSGIMPVPMATTQDFANWVCGPKIRPKYLLYVFRAMKPEFERLTIGSTHKTIYMPDIAEFVTPLPPLEEQDDVVEQIERGTRAIDALVNELRDAI